MPALKFTKMHGLGNDFVVIDGIRQAVALTTDQIRAIADRHLGIGCDQLLIVEKSTQPAVDFYYRIFNADGTEVGQCGNGARCLASFVHAQALTTATIIKVQTATTQLTLHYKNDDCMAVVMGVPDGISTVKVGGKSAVMLSLGNPHVVFTEANLDNLAITTKGMACQNHFLFPDGVNVGFMQIIDAQNIQLRVYERGSGETLACGSGACAAVVAGIWQGVLQSPVTVHLKHGTLSVAWQLDEPVVMTGPATTVFEGELLLKD